MKVGDKIVCIKGGKVWVNSDFKKHNGPQTNDILTINDIIVDERGVGLVFYKYGSWTFAARWFRPLITDHAFTNEITEKLANEPIVKEKIEKIKEKEIKLIGVIYTSIITVNCRKAKINIL